MSDTGRNDFSNNTHDAQKSYLEQATDVASSALGRVAAVLPNSAKSSSQQPGTAQPDGLQAQASNFVSSSVDSVKETVGSEPHRKDFTTSAKEKITPDSQKSTLGKTVESVTDGLDRAAAAVSSDSNKSLTQEIFDKGRRENDSRNAKKVDM